MRKLLFIIFLTSPLFGCIPAMIVAVTVDSVKSTQERDEFNREIHEINRLRVDAGQPPLDYCTEKYNFDKYWARKDPKCNKKVKELDGGKKGYTSREYEQMHEVIENR